MTNRFDVPVAPVLRPDDSSLRQAAEREPGLAQKDTSRRGESSGSGGDVAPALLQPSSTAPNYRRSLFRR